MVKPPGRTARGTGRGPDTGGPDTGDPGAHDSGAHDAGAHDPGARDPGARDTGAHDRDAYEIGAHDRDAYDPDAYVEAVLATVERIPPGRVMSYGAVADHLRDRFDRGSARRVGTIMATYGAAVPWHRVVTAAGRLPPGHESAARRRLCAEGVAFAGNRVHMPTYTWSP